jgi:hypothetical protein
MRPHVKIDGSRTDAGRKIDAWRFSLPDGTRLEIDVHLHAHGEEMWFTTKNAHPAFRHLTHKATDLAVLRTQVQADVHEVIEVHFGADWIPSYLVTTKRDRKDLDENRHGGETHSVQLKFTFAPVRMDARQPPGNDGLTRLIANDQPFSVLQRNHRDRFDVEKNDMRTDSMRRFGANHDPESAVVLREGPGVAAGLEALQETLDRFSLLFADRMGPEAISREGLPAPEELTRLMKAAVDPDTEVAPDEPDDLFRM